MADKKQETLAEKYARYGKEQEEVNKRFLSFLRGAAKAVTTDIPGFIADVADKLAGDTTTLGEKDRSSQLFERLTGIKSDGSNAETLGGMIGPEGLLKAIIVPAFLTKSLREVKIAERALQQGINKDKVYETTGVFKLPENIDDGVLRSIIDDRAATLVVNKTKYTPGLIYDDAAEVFRIRDPLPAWGERATNLGETLKHPYLYKLIPDLKDIRIVSGGTKLKQGEAYFSAANNTIGLGPHKTAEDLMVTVLHEIQHGVQNRFSMNSGSNPTLFFDDVNKFDRAINASARLYNESAKTGSPEAKDFLMHRLFLEQLDKDSVKSYKRTAGEAEARAAEKMYLERAKITKPLDYYGDEYELNRMIVGPEYTKKVDSDPDVKSLIQTLIERAEKLPQSTSQ